MSFIFTSLIAQSNYKSGYLVKNNKDTVRGFILEAIESDYSKLVNFKSDSGSSARIFLPGDIQSFGVGSRIYKSISFLNTDPEILKRDSCFAKKLITGKYDLFVFARGDRQFYLIKNDTSTYFLYNSLLSNNGELITQGNYTNTLNLISIPCEKLASRYDRVGYGEKEMSDFVLALNKCISPETAVSYYQKPKSVMQIFLFAGGLPLGMQSQLTIEGLMRFSLPAVNKNTFLNVGLHYSSTHSAQSYVDPYYGDYSRNSNHTIYSVPLTIQYDFISGIIRPYIYGGIGIAYLHQTVSGEPEYIATLDKPVQNFGISFVVGIGIEAKIINRLFVRVDYRYELVLQYPAIGIAYQFK
jgi:hypothetical protein